MSVKCEFYSLPDTECLEWEDNLAPDDECTEYENVGVGFNQKT